MYNIKLVHACDCLRSVHCQISVTISNRLLPHSSFLTSFLPFFHTELVHLHQTYWATLTPLSLFPHHPSPKSFLSVFWFDEISHSLLSRATLQWASVDSHSCELVKGGVIASLENGFSQPFTPSYSSYILPAPSFTMWAYEEMARLIAWLELCFQYELSPSPTQRDDLITAMLI